MRLRPVPIVLTVVLTTGCVPSTPDEAAWSDQARRTVETVASEVASTAVVLGEEEDDDLLGRSAVVMTVASEEAASSAVQSFSSAQPPPGRHGRYDDVVAELDEATDLLTEARIAVVDDHGSAYPALRDDLEEADSRLRALAHALGRRR